MCSCKAKTRTVCPQHSKQKRKERWSVFAWGPPCSPKPGVGCREKGAGWGGLGEWQCEVRWGARRAVARRERGAVGNVGRRESQSENVVTN